MLWLLQSWLVLLLDVSVKSLALAVLAAIGMAIFRVQNANIRHRVWSAVLLGMIALPLLVPVTPTATIPVWLLPEFRTQPVVDIPQTDKLASAFDTPRSNAFDESVGANPAGIDWLGKDPTSALIGLDGSIEPTIIAGGSSVVDGEERSANANKHPESSAGNWRSEIALWLATHWPTSRTRQLPRWWPSPGSEIEVLGLEKAKPRRLFVLHQQRKLAGSLLPGASGESEYPGLGHGSNSFYV